MPFGSSPKHNARAIATSRPRDRAVWVGSSIRTRNFVITIYRDSARKKSGNSAACAAASRVWSLPPRGTMVRCDAWLEGLAAAMNTSLVQLTAFVVLAAVVLATGFGALGPVAGGF